VLLSVEDLVNNFCCFEAVELEKFSEVACSNVCFDATGPWLVFKDI
jgi:hypothetical protein